MLVVFHSRAAADILMFDRHALPLLRAAGKTFDGELPDRGVFTAEQLPAAIQGLKAAIDAEAPRPDPDEPDDDAPAPTGADAPVSLRQRAWPLLDMLQAAARQQVDVMWEPA